MGNSAALNGPAGPREHGPLGRAGGKGRESRWSGLTSRGPEWDPLVGGSAHQERGACGATLGLGGGCGARVWLAVDAARGWPTRSLLALRGPRAREQGRKDWLTGVSLTRSGRASSDVAPSWLPRGLAGGRQRRWLLMDGGRRRFLRDTVRRRGRRGVHRNDKGKREGASQRLGFT
uniref:Epstein-Barr virus EBNA-1-like protein n=1 Tax=Oryza sativa subsp. japonica TaxID=39947 RepID=Q6YZ64_ORYSJ|nr:Epstein-Barr virus EBNA-1-like protein [Oryza sativa Japonica Group]